MEPRQTPGNRTLSGGILWKPDPLAFGKSLAEGGRGNETSVPGPAFRSAFAGFLIDGRGMFNELAVGSPGKTGRRSARRRVELRFSCYGEGVASPGPAFFRGGRVPGEMAHAVRSDRKPHICGRSDQSETGGRLGQCSFSAALVRPLRLDRSCRHLRILRFCLQIC